MSKISIVIVIAISIIFFLLSGFLLKGSLNDKAALGNEINAPGEALYHYNISLKVPYKHRVLFPLIVKSTYAAFKDSDDSQLFYNIYIFWSGFFFVGATLSFFFLLKTFHFERFYIWVGTLIFLISPAVLSAYAYPVHTREDILGYMLINLCLIFIIKNRLWGIYVFSILGVLCRETLLLFPLIFFVYVNFRKGFYILFFCVIVFLTLRFGMGNNRYEVLEMGLIYNLRNMDHTIGFLFLVFSFMWFPFLYDTYKVYRERGAIGAEPISVLRRSSMLAFVLVLATTFIGGRFNEMRLMFILFPWVISIFLYNLRSYSLSVVKLVTSHRFGWYALLGSLFFITMGVIINHNLEHISDHPNLKFPHSQWIVLSCIYFYITVLCFPFYRMLMKKIGQ